MMIFNHKEASTTTFTLAGFKFLKEVTFMTDYVQLRIYCHRSKRLVIEREIADIDDWYCQCYGIKQELNSYILETMTDYEKVFAHLTSNDMNHELID